MPHFWSNCNIAKAFVQKKNAVDSLNVNMIIMGCQWDVELSDFKDPFENFMYFNIPRAGHSLFFPGSLSAQFFVMDCYGSITHFPDFHVSSSLNRSQETSALLFSKSAKMR